MKKTGAIIGIIFLLAVFWGTPSRAYGQLLLPEEAPPALLESKLGDADVELFFAGYWKASLTVSLSFGYDSDLGTLVPSVFPEFPAGIIFQQIPDLTLSLWIQQKYFFETAIQEDSIFNTFLLGYRGDEDDFLRTVLIGNTGIFMGRYGFLQFSEQPQNSIGASAFMKSERTRHEAMLRYEPADTSRVFFRGNNRIDEIFTPLKEYRDDRRFLFPDGDVENVRIYLQDPEGGISGSDGNLYRRVDTGEVFISEADGLLVFNEPRRRRVLIYYTKNGASVGDAALGDEFFAGAPTGTIDPAAPAQDFDWGAVYLGEPMTDRRITIEGRDALLIYEPGVFSPFALLNTYELPDDAPEEERRISCVLLPKDNIHTAGGTVPLTAHPGSNYFSINPQNTSIRDPAHRYPYAGPYPLLYGPDREQAEGYYGEILKLIILEPVEGYSIDANAVPGSVFVSVNGIAEPRFTVDYGSGELTLHRQIFPNDTVEITFRTTGPGSGGNVLMGFGNRFVLNPAWSVSLGLGLNWNLQSGSYSTKPGENPGSVLVTAGAAYTSDRFNAAVDAGLSFSTSDTRGLFRGAGMDEGGFYREITDKGIYPSSVPAGFVDEGSSVTVSLNSRGKLIYTNFRSSSLLTGSVLMPYTWTPPDDQVYSYETGQKPGPAVAASGGASADTTVMVMDFEVTPSTNWVGAQIPLIADSGYIDLSQAESLSFYWTGEDLPADLTAYVHLGSIGEDLDGDGILDEESSAYARGFPFNDPANGAVLLIGTSPENAGDGILDSEDTNGNGILDPERDDLVVKKDLPALPGSSWSLVEVPFDGTDRSRLHAVSGLRILLHYGGAADTSGRLVIGGISVESSPYFGETDPSGSISVREVYEFQADPPAAVPLSEAFPEVAGEFNSGETSQKLLEIAWGGAGGIDPIPAGGTWRVTGYTTPLPLQEYRNLQFYYRIPEITAVPGGTVSLEITGSDGNGIIVGLPAEAVPAWTKASVDLLSDTLLINDAEFPGGSVTRTETSGSLSKIVFTGSGTSTGKLYADEIHLRNARVAAGAGMTATGEYVYDDDLISIRGFPVVSNLRIREQAALIGDRFAAGFAEDYTASSISSATEFEADIAYIRTGINADVLWAAPRLAVSGGHSLQIPSISSPVVFTDRYSQRHDGDDEGFSRANQLAVHIPRAAGLTLGQETALVSGSLTQTWSALLRTSLEIPLFVSGDLQFEQVSAGYTEPLTGYFADWITAYRFYAPWTGDGFPEQSWSSSVLLRVETLPAGGLLEHSFGYRQFGRQTREQRNSVSVNAEIPLTFRAGTPGEWSLTARYGRNGEHVLSAPSVSGFLSGFSYFGFGYAAQEYFYGGIPFYEIFAPGQAAYFTEASSGFVEAAYTAETGILLSRISSSRLLDLFVPSSAELNFYRALTRQGIIINDRLTWELSLRTTALNLFGRLGLHPVLRFYDTDEFTTLLELSQTRGTGMGHRETSFRLRHMLLFLGGNAEELLIDNTLEITNTTYPDAEIHGYSTSDEIRIRFLWRTPAPFSLRLDFIDERNQSSLYFEHTESLETQIGPRFPPPGNALDFGVLVSHSTSLVIPETAHILARIALGMDRNSASLWIFGLHGGVEFKISF